MKKNQKTDNGLQDFRELNDRIIAEPTDKPIFAIKTNLDPKEPTEENPYYQGESSNKESFNNYFGDK